MAKKILSLCSSPRKNSNTNTIVDWVTEGAAGLGAHVDRIDVARLHYRNNGCIACMACQKSDKFECAIQDDATPILKKIPDYDVLVLATPIYFFGPNAQLKLILDRMFCHVKINPETGEPRFTADRSAQILALVATSGGELDGGLGLTDQTFRAIAQFSGVPYYSLLVPNAPQDPSDLQTNTELKKRARDFGWNLVKEKPSP